MKYLFIFSWKIFKFIMKIITIFIFFIFYVIWNFKLPKTLCNIGYHKWKDGICEKCEIEEWSQCNDDCYD